MKKSIILALLVSFAGQAQANDQLARNLGVEPGQFTTAELIQLSAAIADDNHAQARHLRNGGGDFAVSTKQVGQSQGHRQLANTAGVDPDRYTTAQIVQIQKAQQDDQWARVRHLRAQERGTVATLSTTDVATAGGHHQMAASLGVEPTQYSTPQLIKMRSDMGDDD